jgi:putative flippase GtrA
MRRSLRCCLPGRGPGDQGTGRRCIRSAKELFCALPDALQFLVTGGVVAMFGMLMMSALKGRGVPQAPAFYTQLAVTLQMNLAANSMLTWRYRSGRSWQERVATWTRFHVSRSPGILLNIWAFPVAAAHLGLASAYWGSMALATVLNFLLAKFWVFRRLQPS